MNSDANYVAWLCYRHDSTGNRQWLKLCDSDTSGAFQVYKHPDADLPDAAMLLKRWAQKYPDTDLGLKTADWLKRRGMQGSILR